MLVITCRSELLLLHFQASLASHGQDRARHHLLGFEPGNALPCHCKFCLRPAASNPPSFAAAPNPVAHLGGQERTFPGLEPWRCIFLPRPADPSHQSLAAVPSPAAHHVGSARFLLNLVILWSFQSGLQCSPRLVGLPHQECRGHHNRVIRVRNFLRLKNPYRAYP